MRKHDEPKQLAPYRLQLAEWVVFCFFVVFLVFQLTVPVVQWLWAPRPARFGWQMYSVISAPPQFTLLLRDGTTQSVVLDQYVTSMRGDIPLARYIPAHLCQLYPETRAVRYELPNDAQTRLFECEAPVAISHVD